MKYFIWIFLQWLLCVRYVNFGFNQTVLKRKVLTKIRKSLTFYWNVSKISRKLVLEKFCEKKYDFEWMVENVYENFKRVLRISWKFFNENFRWLFRCLKEIFAKEIERKFENPTCMDYKEKISDKGGGKKICTLR